jgi:hypothetical protein
VPRIARFCTYDTLLTTVVFLAIVAACGLSPMQTDTWWQLRAGRDMWASKRVLLSDVYSHTAYGAFWPNHEWLSEVIFYVLYVTGGLGLLTLFSAALIAAGWAFTWKMTRAPVEDRCFWIGLALIPAAGWWEPRPHAFSLLFIPLMFYLLVREKLLWLPIVFVIWANVHGGVLLGWVLLGAGLTAQVFVDRRRWRKSLAVLLACAAAMTMTPLNVHFWTEIPKSLARINQYTLDEWKRPTFGELVLLPFWGFAAVLVAAFVRHRARLMTASAGDAALCAGALVLLPGALSAVRNVGPFLMIGIPALAFLLQRRPPRVASEQRPLLNLAFIAVATLAVTGTLGWAYLNEVPRLRWHPVPAGAVAALRQCPDNLYNRYDEGGPLLWFVPEKRVFLDGRQDPFPQDLVKEHIALETGQTGPETVFERHGIRCAYLPRISPVFERLTADGWKPIYADRRWVVLTE